MLEADGNSSALKTKILKAILKALPNVGDGFDIIWPDTSLRSPPLFRNEPKLQNLLFNKGTTILPELIKKGNIARAAGLIRMLVVVCGNDPRRMRKIFEIGTDLTPGVVNDGTRCVEKGFAASLYTKALYDACGRDATRRDRVTEAAISVLPEFIEKHGWAAAHIVQSVAAHLNMPLDAFDGVGGNVKGSNGNETKDVLVSVHHLPEWPWPMGGIKFAVKEAGKEILCLTHDFAGNTDQLAEKYTPTSRGRDKETDRKGCLSLAQTSREVFATPMTIPFSQAFSQRINLVRRIQSTKPPDIH